MRIRTAVFALLASSALFFASEKPIRANAQYTLNFGTVAPEGTPWADQLRAIEKRLEKESQGRINVKIFLGGAMGSEIEMIQDVQRGQRLQGGGFSTGAVGEALGVPVLSMIELPFLFRNTKEADVILDEVLYEPTKKQLGKKNIAFYSWSENGWRSFATKGGPATSPEQLRQYKMRSQESPVHLDMYKALGVQAIAKPVSEVLPALNTGIVTGFDNTPLFSLAASWITPVTHYTLTKHIYQPAAVFYSKSFVDKLPPDLQRLLMSNHKEEAIKGRQGVRSQEASLLQIMKGMNKTIVELTPEQRKAFRKAVRRKTHAAFLSKNPKLQGTYRSVTQRLKQLRQK